MAYIPALTSTLAAAALVFSTGAIAASRPATSPAATATEAQVREMLQLPANAKLRYLADDGAPLSLAAFTKHVGSAPFDISKDDAGVTTLQFMEIGGVREIGTVKRLPLF